MYSSNLLSTSYDSYDYVDLTKFIKLKKFKQRHEFDSRLPLKAQTTLNLFPHPTSSAYNKFSRQVSLFNFFFAINRD